ncbi:MAG: polysaccharide deacetylase family protein [Planctomycetes bacterium]|nr:polysaccharide deacetylase family protein [Planctomycetota bacterium]
MRTIFCLTFVFAFVLQSAKAESTIEQLGYDADAKLLIVNADDCGMCQSETEATWKAMEAGLVTSCTMMVPCPDFERAAKFAAEHPELDVGLHLTLNSEWGDDYRWGPVLPREEVPSLVRSDGTLWNSEIEVITRARSDEAIRELEAQVRRAMELGVRPTHVDAHMGCYQYKVDLFPKVIDQICEPYNLPSRIALAPRARSIRERGFACVDRFAMYYDVSNERSDPDARRNTYIKFLRELQPGLTELAIHVALDTPEIREISGSWVQRFGDYKFWTSDEAREIIEEEGIILIGYRRLQELQAKNWNLENPGPIIPEEFLTDSERAEQGEPREEDF